MKVFKHSQTPSYMKLCRFHCRLKPYIFICSDTYICSSFFGYILCTEILFLNTMNNRLQNKIVITSGFWIRMSVLKWMNPSTIWYSLSYKSFFIHIFGSLWRALVSTSESNSSISFHQKMSPGKTGIWNICRGDNGNVFINSRVFPGSEWAFGAWMCPTVSRIGLPSVRAGQ